MYIQFVLSEDIKDNYLGDRGQLSQQKFMSFLPTFQNWNSFLNPEDTSSSGRIAQQQQGRCTW